MGWKLEFDISALSGHFLVQWAPEQSKEVEANGRYLAVRRRFDLVLQLNIVEVKFRLSFGIDVSACGTGLTGTVSLEVEFKSSVEAKLDKEQLSSATWPLITKCEAKSEVLAKAEVLGYPLLGASLSAGVGLELEGSFTLDVVTPRAGIDGVLKMKPMTLMGYIKGPRSYSARSIDPPIELVKRQDLHTFKTRA